MAKFTSTYPGKLILPSGAEVAKGDALDLQKADLENEGVKAWIDAGHLVKADSK